MKLRNKKTGEIIETDFDLSISIPDDEKLYGCNTYTQLKGYNSLAELNSEWEDVPEEPKEFWFVNDVGEVEAIEEDDSEETESAKQIGNYFETKEEAEKAVEKLNAWKRLKDKGFKFIGWQYDITNQKYIITMKEKGFKEVVVGRIREDLDLLFSQEDE